MDSDLEKLEKTLDRFNMFDVINRAHKEQVHSEIISWLLDPYENHGMSDSFLKTFLKDVLKRNRGHTYAKLSPIKIDIMSFANAKVQTEEMFSNKRRADITILCETDENKLYVLIENKLFSGEGEEQTKDYVIETEKRYPNYEHLYIFMTPELKDAESKMFLPYSYVYFIELLEDFLKNNDELNDNTRFIIKQLKWNIEVNILKESEIEELCVKIYEKHSKAIDKIIQVKPTFKNLYQTFGQETINKLGDDWMIRYAGTFCQIFKRDWKKKYNPGKPYCFIHYEFNEIEIDYVRIAFHWEPAAGQDYRKEFRKELEKTGLKNDKRFDFDKAQVLFSKKVVKSISKDKDDAINKGVNDMVKLIRDTVEYIDKAVENFNP